MLGCAHTQRMLLDPQPILFLAYNLGSAYSCAFDSQPSWMLSFLRPETDSGRGVAVSLFPYPATVAVSRHERGSYLIGDSMRV